MLNVLGVLNHDSWAKLCKALPQLWNNPGSYEIFNRLLTAILREDIYIKLCRS